MSGGLSKVLSRLEVLCDQLVRSMVGKELPRSRPDLLLHATLGALTNI